jgi:hypothetical protein
VASVPGVSGSTAGAATRAARPSRSSRHAAQRRRRGLQRSRAWRTLRTAASFTLLLALAAGGVATYAYQKYNGQITRVAVLQTNDKNIRDAARQQNAANFLVIGSDSRAGITSSFGNVSGARSDTAMLVHLSPDRRKARIISIPRDSWVDIPDCKGADGQTVPAHSDMFNSAFTVGGPAWSNPARLTSFLDAATRAITVDKGTTFSDLRTLASSLQGLDPKRPNASLNAADSTCSL